MGGRAKCLGALCANTIMETFPIPQNLVESLFTEQASKPKQHSKNKSSLINKYVVAGEFRHLALKDVESEQEDRCYSKVQQ